MYQKSFNSRGSKSFSSRPSNNRPYRPHGRPQGQSNKRQGMGEYIDPSKFINKAVITEEVEHFMPGAPIHRLSDR
jgi:hypothetical protein